jgi:multiple sugar transport system substrate-binding protein
VGARRPRGRRPLGPAGSAAAGRGRGAAIGLSARAALLVLAALAGCGGASDGATVVQLWAMGREGEMVERLVPAFERDNPGIRVRVQQLPWSAAHEKLLTAFVGEAMPDVVQAGNTWLPELVALEALEPLDPWIARPGGVDPADDFPGILATNVVDGTTWGVPWYVDTRVLFYRADLLEAAGHPHAPRTWDEWRAAMQAVKARGDGGYPILLPLREWQPLVILALQQGSTLLRDGGRFGDFRGAAFRRAFDFYVGLFRDGLAPGTGEAAVANLYQDFATGFVAMTVTGPWNLGEFARRLPAALAERWATAPMPAPDGTAVGISLAGGASLALFRGSPRKEEAWRLVEYLSAPAQQARFHELTGDLPARPSAWRAAALDHEPRTRAFWAQLAAVSPTPAVPEWERIATLVTEHAEAAVRGLATADEALAALDADVDRTLAKRRWILDEEAR